MAVNRFFCKIAAFLVVTVLGFSCTKSEPVKITPNKGGEFITDLVFRQHCLDMMDEFDKDKDGVFTEDDAARITELYLDSYRSVGGGIKSLEGIEFFTGLTHLSFGNNSVEEADLSHNTGLISLDCSRNKLSTLNLSANTQLETLNCSQNKLTEINVNGLTLLKFFNCGNNRLTTLDVSKNTLLEELTCDGWERGVNGESQTTTNAIALLDVSANEKLTTLSCRSNEMTELVLSDEVPLILMRLDCGNNKLQSIDVTDLGELTVLTCSGNQIAELDLTGCKKLATLDCSANKLPSLSAKGTSMLTLYCSGNNITELTLTGCSRMSLLNCSNNKIGTLDISDSHLLRSLFFANNVDGMTLYVSDEFDKKSFLDYEETTDTVIKIKTEP